MDIERLRALEKKWRDELPYKGSAWEERHDIIEDCADDLSALIAELGQEVGAVALIEAARDWIAKAPHGDNCYLDHDHAYGNSCYSGKESILSVLESPAHTSEARDAEWNGAVFERGYSAGYRAALGAASAECRRVGEALDDGGNTYVRYEDAIKCAVSVGRLGIPAIELETFDPAWVVAALKWVATDESTCKLSRREAKEQARLICAMYNLPVDAAMRQEAE